MEEKRDRIGACRKVAIHIVASLLAVVCWLCFRKKKKFSDPPQPAVYILCEGNAHFFFK